MYSNIHNHMHVHDHIHIHVQVEVRVKKYLETNCFQIICQIMSRFIDNSSDVIRIPHKICHKICHNLTKIWQITVGENPIAALRAACHTVREVAW